MLNALHFYNARVNLMLSDLEVVLIPEHELIQEHVPHVQLLMLFGMFQLRLDNPNLKRVKFQILFHRFRVGNLLRFQIYFL